MRMLKMKSSLWPTYRSSWKILLILTTLSLLPPVFDAHAGSRPGPTRLSGQVTVSPVTVSSAFLSPEGTVSQQGTFSTSASLTLSGRAVRPPTLSATIECVADDDGQGIVWMGNPVLDSACLPQGDTRSCKVPITGTWDGTLPESLATTASTSELYTCTLAISLSGTAIEGSSGPFSWLREQAQTIQMVTLDEGQTEAAVEGSVPSWNNTGEDLPLLVVVEEGETQTVEDQSISDEGIIISVTSPTEFSVGTPMLVPLSPVVTLGPDHSEFDQGVLVCLTPEVDFQDNPALELYSYEPALDRWISCTEQGPGRCEDARPDGASDAMVCARVFHFSDWVLGDGTTFRMRFTLDDSVALDSQEAGLLTKTDGAIAWRCKEGSSCPSSLPDGAIVFSQEVSLTPTSWDARLQLSQCNGSGVCTYDTGKNLEVSFASDGLSNGSWVLGTVESGITDDNGSLSLSLDSTQKAAWYTIKASIALNAIINVPPGVKASGSSISCPGEQSSQNSATLIECLNIVTVPDVDSIVRTADGSITVSAAGWTGTGKNLDTGTNKGTASIGWANEEECSQSSVLGTPPSSPKSLADPANPSGNQTGTTGTLPAPTEPYARAGVTYSGLTAWGYCIPVGGVTAAEDLDWDKDGFTENGGDCDDIDPDVHPSAAEECDGEDNNCDGNVDEGLPDFDQDGKCDNIDPDDDNDGAEDQLDGNDFDPSVYPGAEEIPNDGIDQDQSGADFIDLDRDGYDAAVVEGGDCDDTDASIYPAAAEVCDDIDNNCDEKVDPMCWSSAQWSLSNW